jgi:hypothetical protein
MMKKKIVIPSILLILIILAMISNPTKDAYLTFSEKETGVATPEEVEIEHINFVLFSTFAPKGPMDHYGIVHLGLYGQFFQISEGQFDYPWWLEFFN